VKGREANDEIIMLRESRIKKRFTGVWFTAILCAIWLFLENLFLLIYFLIIFFREEQPALGIF
jgi:hypothetical protein